MGWLCYGWGMPKHEYTVKAEPNGCHSIICGCGLKFGLFETYFAHLDKVKSDA